MGRAALTQHNNPLQGVQQLGLDTAPFIYFIERNPIFIDRARAVFRLISAGTITGYSSVITLTEVLTQPLQTNNHAVVAEYRSLLLDSENLFLIPVTPAVAERAAELRATYQLRTPDAIQIAAALETQCDAFLTNDRRLQRVNEIRILVFADLVDIVPQSSEQS